METYTTSNSTWAANGQTSLILGCQTIKICKKPNVFPKVANLPPSAETQKAGSENRPGKRPENVRRVACGKRAEWPHSGGAKRPKFAKTPMFSRRWQICHRRQNRPETPAARTAQTRHVGAGCKISREVEPEYARTPRANVAQRRETPRKVKRGNVCKCRYDNRLRTVPSWESKLLTAGERSLPLRFSFRQ